MADISKITLPSGTTYNLKDAEARELIADLQEYTDYLGVTTSALTDGATTNPITIGGKSVTAVKGNIANYGSKEFIFNGTAWQEFGDMSGLGALAYKDSASASYTPTGSVSQPTFTGTELTSTGKFTPAGTVSKPTFTGTALTSTGTFTPAGSIAVSSGSTGTKNYTPAGTVSKPNITVTPTTTTVNSITGVGSLPSATMPQLSTSVENETLTIGWSEGSFSAGSLPTKGADTTVMTGATAALASTPTFTGTGTVLTAAFTGTEGSVSVSGTPAGTVSKPTFSGTEGNISVSGTPAGTVSKPTFSGTNKTITVS